MEKVRNDLREVRCLRIEAKRREEGRNEGRRSELQTDREKTMGKRLRIKVDKCAVGCQSLSVTNKDGFQIIYRFRDKSPAVRRKKCLRPEQFLKIEVFRYRLHTRKK